MKIKAVNFISQNHFKQKIAFTRLLFHKFINSQILIIFV